MPRLQSKTWSGNHTSITGIVFVGLSNDQRMQIALFVVIFTTYMLTMLGNLLIIILVQSDSRLHTPMYFFLTNLSLLEMGFVTSIVPQTLTHLLAGNGKISFKRCVTQMYFTCSLGCTEGLLLAAMAYDRYLAICYPLVYAATMNRRRYLMLGAASWLGAFLISGMITAFIMRLPFCGPHDINHFFCEFEMVLRLACVDTHFTETIILGSGVIILLAPFTAILISYGLVMMTVVDMKSGAGRSKAFSTCASHLMVVVMFYGCLIALYMRVRSPRDPSFDKYVSIFYVVITPLLNPVIYTLRNKDVHAAVAKALQRKVLSRRAD
ncbi:olfactory receptor 2D2-like [Liasis olivaceus]